MKIIKRFANKEKALQAIDLQGFIFRSAVRPGQ